MEIVQEILQEIVKEDKRTEFCMRKRDTSTFSITKAKKMTQKEQIQKKG